MAVMQYKGYLGVFEFDEDAETFHGRVVNTRDVITFEGRSAKELRRALADSVEDYLAFCAERGEEPEKPFSGKFVVRIDPELHRDLVVAAARANKSLNAFVVEALTEHAHAGV